MLTVCLRQYLRKPFRDFLHIWHRFLSIYIDNLFSLNSAYAKVFSFRLKHGSDFLRLRSHDGILIIQRNISEEQTACFLSLCSLDYVKLLRTAETEKTTLKKEVERLKKELESFDPAFFEEIEDLKYNYNLEVKKNVLLEERLKKVCDQFGIKAKLPHGSVR